MRRVTGAAAELHQQVARPAVVAAPFLEVAAVAVREQRLRGADVLHDRRAQVVQQETVGATLDPAARLITGIRQFIGVDTESDQAFRKIRAGQCKADIGSGFQRFVADDSAECCVIFSD